MIIKLQKIPYKNVGLKNNSPAARVLFYVPLTHLSLNKVSIFFKICMFSMSATYNSQLTKIYITKNIN